MSPDFARLHADGFCIHIIALDKALRSKEPLPQEDVSWSQPQDIKFITTKMVGSGAIRQVEGASHASKSRRYP